MVGYGIIVQYIEMYTADMCIYKNIYIYIYTVYIYMY